MDSNVGFDEGSWLQWMEVIGTIDRNTATGDSFHT